MDHRFLAETLGAEASEQLEEGRREKADVCSSSAVSYTQTSSDKAIRMNCTTQATAPLAVRDRGTKGKTGIDPRAWIDIEWRRKERTRPRTTQLRAGSYKTPVETFSVV